MKIGVPRESAADERRVAIVPETVKKLAAKKIQFAVEPGAGAGAFLSDAEYQAAGATLGDPFDADAVAKINEPTAQEVARLHEGTTLISLLYPMSNPSLVKSLNGRRLTTISLDMIPRTTLAQSMDVLSSQANIAGYWAVVAAASRLPKYFPMLMTAAGTLTPAKVFIMGCGVAGLQAVGTAKRLGAVVEATDVRPECKEQVESLGGKFMVVEGVEVKAGAGGYAAEQSEDYKKKQAEMIAERIAKADVVITTALIPGRKAPILVKADHVASMKPGSVIVDLAARQGGNVEGCVPGQDVVKNGVTILGPVNAPGALAQHASLVFSRNIEKLLLHLTKDGAWNLNMDEEITKGCVITREGAVAHPKVKELVS